MYLATIYRGFRQRRPYDRGTPYLPLTLPGLVVAFLFAFVFAWNEFLFASTLTFDKAKTLPVQIAGNVTTTGPRYWISLPRGWS